MPYKDKEKDKQRLKAYYEKNKELVKKRGKDWYEANRATVLEQHKEKSDELKESCKKWRKNNKNKIKEYKTKTHVKRVVQNRKDKKKSREKLSNWYVTTLISKSTGIPAIKIRMNNPEVIEEMKYKIKIKRLLKQFSKQIKEKL